VRHIGDAIEQIVEDAIDAIRARDLSRLGELCDLNHGLLASLGVSTQELDLACHIAREEGALGAKLTGAGGGGCVFAIVDAEEDRREAILTAWRARGLRCFATTLGARNQERD
jgi:mevalonate kinase